MGSGRDGRKGGGAWREGLENRDGLRSKHLVIPDYSSFLPGVPRPAAMMDNIPSTRGLNSPRLMTTFPAMCRACRQEGE